MATMMFATLPFVDKIGFDKGAIVGYTTMILAFMLVFFGIRSYRENVSDGHITFGRAFAVGILITLVACVCYVVAWRSSTSNSCRTLLTNTPAT
jgi:cell division protein FtsW (lipid II flippase)